MPKPELLDVEELNRADPDRTWIEPLHQRAGLRRGDLVKVSDGLDRFWCEIRSRGVAFTDEGAVIIYAAVSANETTHYSIDDELSIEPCHIFQIDAATPRAGLRSTIAEN